MPCSGHEAGQGHLHHVYLPSPGGGGVSEPREAGNGRRGVFEAVPGVRPAGALTAAGGRRQ
eukprot:scaffold82130_cov25-Prasinocladus_malaysianus.AAC.1